MARRENKEWLRYSQHIAMMMLDRMEELGITQKVVAEKMGCSQQYISRVLKGTENLSIETIFKIENSLDLRIFERAEPNSLDLCRGAKSYFEKELEKQTMVAEP